MKQQGATSARSISEAAALIYTQRAAALRMFYPARPQHVRPEYVNPVRFPQFQVHYPSLPSAGNRSMAPLKVCTSRTARLRRVPFGYQIGVARR